MRDKFKKEVVKLKMGMLKLMEMMQNEGIELVTEIGNFKMEMVSQMTYQKLKLELHGKKIKKMVKM